jgi:uncharacterized protein YndB with AHSA1/START domain
MSQRSVSHGTFVIERTYEASPARVFAAWADPAAKARWFVGPGGWKALRREIDFRIGGRERLSGAHPDGRVSDFDGVYHDIVADRRIVYSYGMHVDDKRISVSLATVELAPAGSGTRLTFTEQAAFLDGFDGAAGREQGTGMLLDQLGRMLREGN